MRIISYTTVFLPILIVGCQEKDAENNDTGTSESQSCASLSIDECASNSDCSLIAASQVSIDETVECYDVEDNTDVGCRDKDLTCSTGQTFASSGDGNCMLFSDGCTPDGWDTCLSMSSLPSCNDVRVCAELPPSACEGRDDCVTISASSLTIDSVSECYTTGEVEPAGCMDAGVGCPGGITFAGPTLDECMMFYNGCIPDGWQLCDSLNEYATCDESE
ncbi:MAG: hypothetical protein VX278_13180 [Myxococcota bacterium]|nr:hypothetical protein [Myxococcota bacterium]